jgi:hypothetical protein
VVVYEPVEPAALKPCLFTAYTWKEYVVAATRPFTVADVVGVAGSVAADH